MKVEEMRKIGCPGCGKVYDHYPNYWGKICVHCGEHIPAELVHPIARENAEKKAKLKQDVVRMILSRTTEMKRNAD